MFICASHITEPNVKNYIHLRAQANTCAFCGALSKCLDTSATEVKNLLRAIVRYHYDEVLYNPHFGGDYSSTFILAEVFDFKGFIKSKDEEIAELDGELHDLGFYVENEISLHSGYGEDGIPNMLYISIKNEHHAFIDSLPKKLTETNYHDLENELMGIIRAYGDSFSKRVAADLVVYRARTGVAGYKKATNGFDREGKKIFVPFKDKEVGAVPPLKATGGRANRVGVSYLYCATDSYTAIAEVRPHPTDVVSLGQFIASRELKVFDFSEPNLLDFIESDDTLLLMIPYAKMAGIFNTATPPSLEGRYSVSQLISDCIRKEGYDGIQFSSTVGQGKNLVVFNPSYMQFVEGSSMVVEIDKVQYTYEEKQVVGMDDQWEIYYGELT